MSDETIRRVISAGGDAAYSPLTRQLAADLHDARAEIAEMRDIALECWMQWAYESDSRRFDGGLSTLEWLRDVLMRAGLINKRGNPTTEAG